MGDPLGRILADPRHSSGEERFVLLGFSQRRRMLAVMYVDRGAAIRIISARWRRAGNGKIMKKAPTKGKSRKKPADDDILPEYDFRKSAPNNYASCYATGSTVIVLEPDVAAAFPSADEANDALRSLAALIEKHRERHPTSRSR